MIRKILAALSITAAIALFSTNVAGGISAAVTTHTSATAPADVSGPPWG
jgi:hypothetical protein